MKKLAVLFLCALALSLNAQARNINPKDYTRSALGFKGQVKQAVINEYSDASRKTLVSVRTYVFTPKGNPIRYKYENKLSGYSLVYDFDRDSNGSLIKLVITNNGNLDSYVTFEGSPWVETLYSYDSFIVSVTTHKGDDTFIYDASVASNYKSCPDEYYQKIHIDRLANGNPSVETVFTFGEESDRKEYTYNSKGALTGIKTYIDGELDTVSEYYTTGRLGTYTNENGTKKYTYPSVDSKGNWTARKTTTESGAFVSTATQKLIYY